MSAYLDFKGRTVIHVLTLSAPKRHPVWDRFKEIHRIVAERSKVTEQRFAEDCDMRTFKTTTRTLVWHGVWGTVYFNDDYYEFMRYVDGLDGVNCTCTDILGPSVGLALDPWSLEYVIDCECTTAYRTLVWKEDA